MPCGVDDKAERQDNILDEVCTEGHRRFLFSIRLYPEAFLTSDPRGGAATITKPGRVRFNADKLR